MKFHEFYNNTGPVISFELFPPKTSKAVEDLKERLPQLISLQPSFITVTYGALGSTRERTLEFASLLKNTYGIETAHHLTCVGSSKSTITTILEQLRANNIENIVALRGDPPHDGKEFISAPDGYAHGDQLVSHIQDFGGFGIGVAGYPEKHLEAPDFATDLQNLKRKVENGADVIITQLYYDNTHFYRFVDRCRKIGITQPIVPGLMPIFSTEQIIRITKMCGATIPKSLYKKLVASRDDEENVREIGISHTTDQAIELLQHGVPGIHFYVLNRHFQIAEIMERIKFML
ncbi:methylenetetrahydrofolate reductase [NAD(P)H] [SAR202 cluster bacterium AD-802-E10_MRT_200m]|nr:methylenetetrahydrofolate reductase [NAD(P)H] [SAR202 cluster bacterium AD-802-E10_MRT_200m]